MKESLSFSGHAWQGFYSTGGVMEALMRNVGQCNAEDCVPPEKCGTNDVADATYVKTMAVLP